MRPLTTADVARRPAPGATVPTSIRFSPDGRVVTHLLAEPGSLHQSLVVVDVGTGDARTVPTPGDAVDEASLELEERLRRERARELAVGVTRYQWADAADRVLVPMGDGLWLLDGLAGGDDVPPRLVVPADAVDGAILDARLSADGRRIGFVAGDEVHVADAEQGTVVTVTAGAAGTGRTNGLAEYVAQEEMGRPYGFWLSPDGQHVAFCEADETHIPVFRIVHQGSDQVGAGAQEDHRYPFAGGPNAHIRVGVVPADGTGAASPRWFDLDATGIGADRYVARVDWVADRTVVVQLESRDQQRLDVVRYDLTDGTGTVPGSLLWSERSDVWINLHDVLRPLGDGALLWASERTGFRHLEVREADGTLRRVLTEGPWAVTDVIGVGPDEVWFRSTGDDGAASPIDRHVHRVLLDGSAPAERITVAPGVHGGVAHPATGAWVHTWSTPEVPPRTVLHAPDRDHDLHDAAEDPRVAELGLRRPQLRTLETEPLAPGGARTELHAAVYRPDGEGPFPTVVWVYGGPHVQLVTRSWGITVAMRAQLLRQEGFCVAVVDGRGSTDRGLDFEGTLRHRMGTVEVEDQVRLVESLIAEGTTDPARVGIYGWSYGGYLSALCLARRPDVFRAACAGAPVTSWDGYDTHYTERYMGTPTENPDGYRDGSVMAHVEGLRGRDLLLVHGLIDENVHFRHTARLLNALVRADIDHRLLLYPDERHVPRHEADRESMEHRIVEFFQDALAERPTDRRSTG